VTRTQSQAAAALLLAFVGGAVDAASYLVLHKIFTTNMTGNSTQLGIGVGQGSGAMVIPLAAAVSTFVIAIALATTGIELAARRRIRSTAAPALLVEAALVAAFTMVGRRVLRHGAAPDHTVGGFYAMLIIAVVAMGIQTAALTRALGGMVRTTYVSGVLTTFGQHAANSLLPATRGRPSYLRDDLQLGSRRESRIRIAFQLGVWASFVTGALWGAYGTHRWWTWTLLVPLAALLAAIGVDLRRPVHSCVSGPDHPAD
jgi:uncharacterized membrane protein YoaK (UPF0700 family)